MNIGIVHLHEHPTFFRIVARWIREEWWWLAALLVRPEYHGRGIGSTLVRPLQVQARRLGVRQMYLGTDIPGFYSLLGAETHEQVTDTFCIMLKTDI